jgi:GWxTD domain-containing protein
MLPGPGGLADGRSRTTWTLAPTLLAASAVVAAACASSPSRADEEVDAPTHVELILHDYQEMGLLTGGSDFPVVGRVVALRGPGDSAFVGLVASMPPSALSFAREGPLFAASYQVLATFTAGADTVRRLNRREIVRVDDFAETASGEERVFFQHFVKLGPGSYDIDVTLRELARRSQGTRRFSVTIPRSDAPQYGLSTPLVAFRATPRRAYEQPPPLIVSPRSTVTAGGSPLFLVAEDYSAQGGRLRVGVRIEDQELWAETVDPEDSAPTGLATAVVPLPVSALPPGLSEVFVLRLRDGVTRSAPLLVALDDEWAFASFERAVEHLRYALDPDSLEAWVTAPVPERARLWRDFWRATDPDPATLENEFLGDYFDRMSRASERFEEIGNPGWRTDRGRALVQLGEPDTQLARGGRNLGAKSQIEWVYDESLPFAVRLVFVDESDFGVFTLTQRSRIALRQAFRKIREMKESSGSESEASGS